jgi:hypothetical protein
MNASDIITAIVQGDGDDNLDGIEAALRDRKATAAKAALYSLKAGRAQVRPKYLVGRECEVVRRNKSRLVVKLIDPPNGEFGRFSGEVTVAADMIEAIS